MLDYDGDELSMFKNNLPKNLFDKIKNYRETVGIWDYAWPKEVAANVIEAMTKSDYVLTIITAYLRYSEMDNDVSVIAEENTFEEIERVSGFEEKKKVANDKALKVLQNWDKEIAKIIGGGQTKNMKLLFFSLIIKIVIY